MHKPGFLLLLVLALALLVPCAAGAQDIRGAWRPELYVMKDGTELPVDGRIFFTERDWTVLFFVTEEGEPRRGSAEGGTYRLEGENLEFTHRYHLSAGEAMASLPEAPLRMSIATAADAAREPCRVVLSGERLTIFFPSGNRMEFQRSR